MVSNINLVNIKRDVKNTHTIHNSPYRYDCSIESRSLSLNPDSETDLTVVAMETEWTMKETLTSLVSLTSMEIPMRRTANERNFIAGYKTIVFTEKLLITQSGKC